jgi:hypothetical protein
MSAEKKRRRLVVKEAVDGSAVTVYGGLTYGLRDILKEMGFKWDPRRRYWVCHVDDATEDSNEIINELLKRVAERVKLRKVKDFVVMEDRGLPQEWGEVYEEEV